ncbi:hypothetical protein NTGBS_880030 [Candidatus Nitrotoga sp. BS]|nr:hypothetical protein NTGBS_880030 [Candidatus Nitrotoga sp. BS]
MTDLGFFQPQRLIKRLAKPVRLNAVLGKLSLPFRLILTGSSAGLPCKEGGPPKSRLDA